MCSQRVTTSRRAASGRRWVAPKLVGHARPAGGRRPAADVGLRRGEQAGVQGLRTDLAAGERALDRRGVPRRSGAQRISPPAPVERLSGVGPVTSKKLRERGITTVGEVAKLAEAALVSMLGPAADRHLHALAHNRDPRPVPGPPSTLDRGPARTPAFTAIMGALDAVLVRLVDRLARRLRGLRIRAATGSSSGRADRRRELSRLTTPALRRRGSAAIELRVANEKGEWRPRRASRCGVPGVNRAARARPPCGRRSGVPLRRTASPLRRGVSVDLR